MRWLLGAGAIRCYNTYWALVHLIEGGSDKSKQLAESVEYKTATANTNFDTNTRVKCAKYKNKSR